MIKIKTYISILLLLFSINFNGSSENVLIDIKTLIPSAIIDIRYAGTNNFMSIRLNGYNKNMCLLRHKTAQKLKHISDILNKQGFTLKFFDCYRPIRAVRHMVAWTKKNHPDWIGLYVGANVNTNSLLGHTSGNTVDLTLVYTKTGKELNMGTGFDDFSKKAWTKNATGEILKNRMLLFNIMQKNEFENFYSEWWHYTYKGDPGRALDIPVE